MAIRQIDIESSENPFSLSIGDLMAALLLIFVLLLASTLLNLQDEFENKIRVAERYTAIKENLFNQLLLEFRNDLKKWNAEIDPKILSIRFKEPDVFFDKNESLIKTPFKNILSDFFPRYIKVLTMPEFRDNIEEIRIEGHTDSDGPTKGSNRDYDYFYNMSLSQNRTRSVLQYTLSTLSSDINRVWVQKLLTANGLSSSKLLYYQDTTIENKDASRRVEFRIRTNAEDQIQEILRYSKMK
jgi:outer membrane protein OmpA-like peptidoglycan-associated protein